MKHHQSTGQSARTALVSTVFALCGVVGNVQAQFEITTTSGNTTQNFNALANSGTNVVWANDTTITAADSTLDGWSLFTASGGAILAIDAGTGSASAGKFYSFGEASAADRALGGLGSGGAYFGSPPTGSVAGYIAFAATNNSAGTLTGFTLGFDGEQWRNGGNTAAQTMVLEYGIGTDFASVTSWTAPGGLFDWASPVVGATGAAVNGNVAGVVTGRGGTVNGLTWAPGTTLWLRWIERNDTGNDHGLAIDNFSLSWIAGSLPKNLTWTPTTAIWDTTAQNWQEAGPPSVAFAAGDTVNFTDTGLAGSATVTVDPGGVAPSGVNVSHTSGTYTISGGPITATSALQKTGAGTLIIGSAYSNGLNSAAGIVRTSANEVFSNTAAITIGDTGTFDIDGNSETVGALNLTGATISTGAGLLTIGGNVTLALSPTDTPTTISGNLSNGGAARIYAIVDSLAPEDLILNANLAGPGRVNFDGSGTVRIAGDNSAFTGGFQFDSGLTYVLASTKPLGSGQLFLNGGTVDVATPLVGVDAVATPISLGGNGAFFTGQNIQLSGAMTFFGAGTKSYNIADGQTLTFSGTIDNSVGTANASITKAGPGTIIFANDGSLYTGPVTITGGNVIVTTPNGLGLGGVTLDAFLPDAVSLSAPASTTIGTLNSGFGDGTLKVIIGQPTPSVTPVVLNIVASVDGIYAGSIETTAGNVGKVVKSGSGVQTLSGAQSYETLEVAEGKVVLSGVLSTAGGSSVSVAPTTAAALDITISETLASLTIGSGGVVTLTSPPPPPAPTEFAADALVSGGETLAAVPEPGSGMLVLGGLATLLGIRRRR